MYDYDAGLSHPNGSSRMLRISATILALLTATMLPALAGDDGFKPVALFGRSHVIVVHFPVALLTVLMVMEVLRWRRRDTGGDRTVTLLAVLSAASAVASIAMGWVLAGSSSGEGREAQILEWHRWLGVVTGVFAVGVAAVALRRQLSDSPALTRAYRFLLLPATALVGLTGHYGGALAHGENYIESTLPVFMRGMLPPYASSADKPVDVVLPADPKTKIDFWRDIDPIFKKSCYECHDGKEQKGDLRMDSRAALLKGGKDGPGFIVGDGRKSAIVMRSLGEGDDPRMPKKKPPLSDNQIELIKRWIDQGAEWPAKP